MDRLKHGHLANTRIAHIPDDRALNMANLVLFGREGDGMLRQIGTRRGDLSQEVEGAKSSLITPEFLAGIQ